MYKPSAKKFNNNTARRPNFSVNKFAYSAPATKKPQEEGRILEKLDQTVQMIKETIKKTQMSMQANPQQIPSLASMQSLTPIVQYLTPLLNTIQQQQQQIQVMQQKSNHPATLLLKQQHQFQPPQNKQHAQPNTAAAQRQPQYQPQRQQQCEQQHRQCQPQP